ncbi:E3 ubiquitin-protein ligase MARCHF9-like isoform X1 [Lethenteron reissneri]|uniref:E3 ubiquitin-protein ligase MARCHF9-like isoform X1 n=1 Tax=Lethenteron reissneri TaxID=7753 RepID=UPI002AB7C9D7|nr:E3 ubiquitin-protein ligase MARCHF9-like isoform X1 [Lethenteron reissneri]
MLRRGYCEDAETCCCGGVGGGGGGGGALGNFKTLLLPPKRSVSAAMSDQSGYEDSDSSSVGGGRQLTGKQQQQQQNHGAGTQCGSQAQYTDYRVQRGAEAAAAAEAAGQRQEEEEEGATAKERHGDAESLNSGNTGTRTPLCRICFQGPEKVSSGDEETDRQGELLNPCRCNGSVRWTHQPCLLTWISERGSWSCELCYYKFRVRPVNTKHPTQWQGVSLSPIERVQAAAVSLGCLFLLASLVWLVWSGLSPAATWQRRDVLFQICYALYGLMDIVCIGLLVHEGPAVYRILKRWRAVNQRWRVLNYQKNVDKLGKTGPGRASAGSSVLSPLRFHFGVLFLHLLDRFGSGQEGAEASGVTPELVMRVTTV